MRKRRVIRKRASEETYKYAEVKHYSINISEDFQDSELLGKEFYVFECPKTFDEIIKYVKHDAVKEEFIDKLVETWGDVTGVGFETEECLECFNDDGETVPCGSEEASSCRLEGFDILVSNDEPAGMKFYPVTHVPCKE